MALELGVGRVETGGTGRASRKNNIGVSNYCLKIKMLILDTSTEPNLI